MNYIHTLDYLFKIVLANKILLAITMKECLEEFKENDVSTIYHEYIEAHILTDENVHENILGANTEKITDGKKTTFDVLFYAKLPYSNHKIGIIVNAEAQSLHSIDYDVLNRAHYYNARNLSSQYKTLWEDDHYDELRKVVSIWFILDPPKRKQGALNRYVMQEEHLVGNACENVKNIKKNEIIMVYLSKGKCDNDFIQIMSDIKNKKVNIHYLRIKLAKKYGINIDEQMEMEVNQMCNYGSYVFNEGKLEAVIELIIKKMKHENLSVIDAMNQMYIDEQDFPVLLTKINEILNVNM